MRSGQPAPIKAHQAGLAGGAEVGGWLASPTPDWGGGGADRRQGQLGEGASDSWGAIPTPWSNSQLRGQFANYPFII